MKKIFILFLLVSFINVYADKCTYDQKVEFTKLANEIKVDYDEKSKDITVNDEIYNYTAKDYWIELSIYNIAKDFILEISNDYNNEVIKVYDNSIKEGVYSFKDYDYYKIINYKIDIYNVNTCDMYKVKSINFRKPMFNPNYYYDACKSNDDLSICKKYITNSKLVYEAGIGLNEAIKGFRNNEIQDFDGDSTTKSFNNIYIIVGGVILLIGLSGGVYYIIYRKRSAI